MPIKDDEARRSYFRDYMRERRAGKKPEPQATVDLAAADLAAADLAAAAAELAKAKERISELEDQLSAAKSAPHGQQDTSALEMKNAALSYELFHTKNEAERAKKENARLRAENKRLIELTPAQREVEATAKLEKKIASLTKKNEELQARLHLAYRSKTVRFPKKLHDEVRSCLHPDRVQDPELKKRFEKAFQHYNRRVEGYTITNEEDQ